MDNKSIYHYVYRRNLTYFISSQKYPSTEKHPTKIVFFSAQKKEAVSFFKKLMKRLSKNHLFTKLVFKQYTICKLCGEVILNANLSKHQNACDGIVRHTPGTCKHCGIDFSTITSDPGNHTRWCEKRPDRDEAVLFLNQVRSKITDVSRRKAAQKVSQHWKNGSTYKGSIERGVRTRIKNNSVLTKESNPQWYENVCKANANADHQRVCKRTHTFICKRGREFLFDSTWEDALALRLDELDIIWDRPDPVMYTLDGKVRRYYADFYIPDLNLFLDPKNMHVVKEQIKKLKCISDIVNLIILTSKNDCENFTIENFEHLKTKTFFILDSFN